jgi:hypothetical protein
MAGGISGGFDSLLKKQKVSKKLSHEKKILFSSKVLWIKNELKVN